ncbi:histidine phosphatase family protein [Phenylobacterium sp.]|uniref:histidine phosphatase family protein n=1 Tax=Phenylobacterium sp. TaxID=1871053 RepID=UPI003BAC9E2B
MTGASLILVRHGRPAIDPDTPPTTWPLCPEGRAAVEALAGKIAGYRPVAVATSPEPKARETAEIIAGRLGLTIDIDPGLHEHKRQHLSFGTEAAFRERIASIFASPGEAVGGIETADEAGERLARALAQHKGRPLVAVTHGTVLSLYVAKLLGLDAHDLWRNLHTPDAFVLDAQGGLVERISLP